MGLVPAILSTGEICDNRPGRNYLVHVHANTGTSRCYGARHYFDDQRLEESFPRFALALAVLALLVNTTLSVYKPKGMTRYGAT